MRDSAFVKMTNTVLPLSPGQIRALHALYVESQRASAIYPGVPPRPTVTSILLNLSPGATPPVIRLRSGMVTSLVFVDSSGAPWPIAAIDIGNPKAYNLQWDKKSNIVFVQALSTYRSANLAIRLKKFNTPVMLSLKTGQAAVDYRVDIRVPGIGPNASSSIATSLPGTASPLLLNVLNGIPPRGSQTIKLRGCAECEAWLLKRKLYLRTPYTVLSPGWISSMSSADGTHAYEMVLSPVILISKHGTFSKLVVVGH